MEYKGWLGLSSVTGRPGGSIINKTALNDFISENYHYSDHGHKNQTDLGGLNLKGLGVLILVAQITFILNRGSFSSGLSTIRGH